MFKIEGKTFMNIQEAVQWLLENNALPFQSSANYIANTEIGLGTIVNPSPAKVRIGSLIFFADSKVSTVTGITENGFICSNQYNNLVDDIAYVTGVAINASGHLITTLSDGQTIDAGIVKQVSGFSIDGSQHLIVSFNDGTSADLGAIFSGDVNISGTLNATKVTGNEIVETMAGYSYTPPSSATNLTVNIAYAGVVKNGNKLTLAIALTVKRTGAVGSPYLAYGSFTIPTAVADKLYPIPELSNVLEAKILNGFSSLYSSPINVPAYINKEAGGTLRFTSYLSNFDTLFVQDTTYYIRYEVTFLLSENLAS